MIIVYINEDLNGMEISEIPKGSMMLQIMPHDEEIRHSILNYLAYLEVHHGAENFMYSVIGGNNNQMVTKEMLGTLLKQGGN